MKRRPTEPLPIDPDWLRNAYVVEGLTAPQIAAELGCGKTAAICARWRESFEAFLTDMGERPLGTTLDRIDPNDRYEPGNCRWATASEQANNTTRSGRVCMVKGCDRPHYGRGWCQLHHRRWLTNGDPLTVQSGHRKRDAMGRFTAGANETRR